MVGNEMNEGSGGKKAAVKKKKQKNKNVSEH